MTIKLKWEIGWDYVSAKPSSIITTPQIKNHILEAEKSTTVKINVFTLYNLAPKYFLFVAYPNIAQEDP